MQDQQHLLPHAPGRPALRAANSTADAIGGGLRRRPCTRPTMIELDVGEWPSTCSSARPARPGTGRRGSRRSPMKSGDLHGRRRPRPAGLEALRYLAVAATDREGRGAETSPARHLRCGNRLAPAGITTRRRSGCPPPVGSGAQETRCRRSQGAGAGAPAVEVAIGALSNGPTDVATHAASGHAASRWSDTGEHPRVLGGDDGQALGERLSVASAASRPPRGAAA